MSARNLHRSGRTVPVLCAVFLGALPVAWAQEDPGARDIVPELVAAVPPTAGITPDWIESIRERAAHPEELLFVTQNVGADCAFGTPAAAWKLTLDPNGQMLRLDLKQQLDQIQNARGCLYESADGTIFTGGGWCLAKPPYVSFDGGETYRAADFGMHPPNSTFACVEFLGQVYVGTGYEPYPAEVYRWIGGPPDDWAFVFGVPWPRTVMVAMVVHDGRLFVGTTMITFSGWEGSIPVYVSDDGSAFNPTPGIPSSAEVYNLIEVGSDLLARTHDRLSNTNSLYRWNASAAQWEFLAPYDLGSYIYQISELVASGNTLFAYGLRPGDPSKGIYRSTDEGLTWERIATGPTPEPMSMRICGTSLYLGTHRDGANTAYIYRLPLILPARGDLNCDGVVDFHDITPFVLAVTNWGRYLRLFPHCDIYLADINRDGYVDFDDINPFVALLMEN